MTGYYSVLHKIVKNTKLLLPLLVLASSCQTYSFYNFQSLKAPDVIIPSDVKTIAFVDRSVSFPVDTISQFYQFESNILRDTTDYSAIMARNCYTGFVENLSAEIGIDTVQFLQLKKKFIQSERSYPPLTWEMVDSLCEKTASDILICLEDIQLYCSYKIVRDEGCFGFTDVTYYALWRIYDPLYRKFINEKLVADSLYSEEFSNSFQSLIELKLPRRDEIFQEVSYEIGSRYALGLSPKWDDISRRYFVSGDQRLVAAKYYVDQDEWEKAIVLWEELSNCQDHKLVGRACFNLALAHEIKEEFTTANMWIEKSIAAYKKTKSLPSEFKEVEKYRVILILRAQDQTKLNTFLGN